MNCFDLKIVVVAFSPIIRTSYFYLYFILHVSIFVDCVGKSRASSNKRMAISSGEDVVLLRG